MTAQILGSLICAVVTAVVTGWASADVGETFNARVAIYAAAVATVVIGLLALAWNLVVAPWQLHEDQAARLRKFERRPDVQRLVDLRERGVQLLNLPVRSVADVAALEAALRSWEAETIAELEKSAPQSGVSAFRVLGSLPAVDFLGAFNQPHNHQKAMLDVRLQRLLAIIRQIESGAG